MGSTKSISHLKFQNVDVNLSVFAGTYKEEMLPQLYITSKVFMMHLSWWVSFFIINLINRTFDSREGFLTPNINFHFLSLANKILGNIS